MKLARAIKNLDEETIKELEALSIDDLKGRIVQGNQAIQTAQDELDKNAEYQEIKENLKAVTGGFKDLKKRQTSVITVCLALMEDKGAAV